MDLAAMAFDIPGRIFTHAKTDCIFVIQHPLLLEEIIEIGVMPMVE